MAATRALRWGRCSRIKIDGPVSSQRRYIQSNNRFFKVSDEVSYAVKEKAPVVALETTIYTHGLPYPDNLQLAMQLDALVRHNGGIPAHCGVLDGTARVGLDSKELERMVADPRARKVSRRDLALITGPGIGGSGLHGGTTIAGTMILAHLAGIKVFATGGLGGVHRGVERHMDISADLTELGRTPVAVIAAGCKGFLDIPRTLEYLETQGVPVATFADGRDGQVKFPAFWSRESSSDSPFTIRDEREAAAAIYANSSLPLTSGMFFPNPVPLESSIEQAEMARIIEEALKRAEAAKSTGAANTPFILNAIRELSNGRSVSANRSLIEANVIRGTRVAVELSLLEQGLPPEEEIDGRIPEAAYVRSTFNFPQSNSSDSRSSKHNKEHGMLAVADHNALEQRNSPVDILVAGSIALDLSCDYKPLVRALPAASNGKPELETSNPAIITSTLGGVGYNVAKAIQLAGGSVRICTRIGEDHAGMAIRDVLRHGNLEHAISISSKKKTAQYIAVNDVRKSLVLGMADMSIFDEVDSQEEQDVVEQILTSKSKWLVVDSNWSSSFLQTLLRTARLNDIRIAFEPVSATKSTRLFTLLPNNQPIIFPMPLINLATPNKLELSAMYAAAQSADVFSQNGWWQVIDALGISSSGARIEMALTTSSALTDEGIPQRCIQLLPLIPTILTKLGAEGVLLTQLLEADDERLTSSESAPYILAKSRSGQQGVGGIYMRLFPPVELVQAEDITSVNGVGDTFLGVLMAALTKRKGIKIEDAVGIAQRGSILSLRSQEAVSPEVAKLKLALEVL